MTKPIKELGLHAVQVVLHPEVEVEIVLNVARSGGGGWGGWGGGGVGVGGGRHFRPPARPSRSWPPKEEGRREISEIAELFDDIGGAQNDDEGSSDRSDDDDRQG